MQHPLWRVAFRTPVSAVEAMAEALEPLCLSVARFEEGDGSVWLIEALCEGSPPQALVAAPAILAVAHGLPPPEVETAPLQDRDWVAHVHALLQPIHAGGFVIHGSHRRGPRPAGARPLLIDAATAFGTGEHETTRACLLALADLADRWRPRAGRILDLGCGTAILAMAAACLWRSPVTAVDIDPEAVRVARRNIRVNRLTDRVVAGVSDGYDSLRVRRGVPYGLICANILARPLIAMAGDLARHLAPDGVAVLSGLLDRQEAQVMAAHRAHGLVLYRRVALGAWRALVIGRPGIAGIPRQH